MNLDVIKKIEKLEVIIDKMIYMTKDVETAKFYFKNDQELLDHVNKLYEKVEYRNSLLSRYFY
jgi:hypothetical protein